jgi:phage terminase small subunit
MRNLPAILTQKQQRFVAEYMVDGNGSRAAIAAGYGHAGARIRAFAAEQIAVDLA